MKYWQAIQKLGKSPDCLVTIALCFIGLYWLPYLILWENSHILIHDNLDGNFVIFKVLLESGHIFSSNKAIIEPFMGGLSRSSFPLEFNFTILWFWLFGPFGAYIFERALIPVVAFLGMFLLLRRHIVPGPQNIIIQTGVALTFALLPFWPFGGLSVAGLPFLLYAFLNLRSGDISVFDWIFIAIYPFYASLIAAGVFIIAVLGSTALYDLLRTKRLNWNMVLGLAIICALFILTHYRLFSSFLFDSGYISHRHEFGPTAGPQDLKMSIRAFIDIFLHGQYHAHSLHDFSILPTIIFALILMYKFRQTTKSYVAILVFLVATSFFYGFWGWKEIAWFNGYVVSIIPIQLQRFHWLHPLLWSLLFAMSLSFISDHLKIGRYFVFIFIGIQIVYVFSYHEIRKNRSTPSYQAFFAKDLFADVKDYINRPVRDYRIVSVGIHPSVTQYNGFYTLDGYSSDYPLEYKHKFRKIIAPELRKNEKHRLYFDNWGCRAYIFPAQEIGYLNRKTNKVVIDRLELNVDVLKSLGGQYIMSAVLLNPEKNPEYALMKAFTNEKSAWNIYLYRVL